MITKRHFFLILCSLMALLCLPACSRQEKLPALAPNATILAFGDSLTYGYGAQPEESYPAVLASRLHRRVVNAGISGETTADGLARFASTLEEHKPSLLLLCMGGNDFLQRRPEGETVTNLRKMLDIAQSRHIPVLLIATPRLGFGLDVPKLYGDLATEYHIPLESTGLEDILRDKQRKSDLIHPNATGYRDLAGAIEKALHRAGAI